MSTEIPGPPAGGPFCTMCGKPMAGESGTFHSHHVPAANTPPKPPSGSKPGPMAMIFGGIVALIVIGAIWNGVTGGDSSDAGDGDALTERTCEIVRDIAADASDGVDSTFETRDRLKDLYDGYGQSAPPDIASRLRALVGAMTTGDYDAAATHVTALDTACDSRGF